MSNPVKAKRNYGIRRLYTRILLHIAQNSCLLTTKYRRLLFLQCGVSIGRNCFIGQHVYFDEINLKGIEIGNNCLITRGCTILSHFLDTKTRAMIIGNVKIGNNTFLGVNTIICKTVCIGDNVVIGAGSVVTTDIPSNSIAAGAPCKVIKRVAVE